RPVARDKICSGERRTIAFAGEQAEATRGDEGAKPGGDAMWALVIYLGFVAAFGFVAFEISAVAEHFMSKAASLTLFLALFFGNFVAAWWATYFVMERALKKLA